MTVPTLIPLYSHFTFTYGYFKSLVPFKITLEIFSFNIVFFRY